VIHRLGSAWTCTWLRIHGRFEDESGAVAAEYVLLLTLIAMAIVAATTGLGLAIAAKYQTTRDCIVALPGSC
jgi:Flp pilus assembly pilin Flp